MMKKVYIILLNWNGWKNTIECLESIFQNTYPNYQVIVCDNASTDGSIAKIEAWAEGNLNEPVNFQPGTGLSDACTKPLAYITLDAKGNPVYKKEYFSKQLLIINNGDNLGFAGGNNVGIRLVQQVGDLGYVWLLNNDTVIAKDSLVNLVKKIEADKEIGICGSKLMYYDDHDKIQAYGGRYNKFLGTSRYITNINELPKIDYVVGASMLISREFLNKVGLMSEEFFLYYEEMDWAVRAKGKFKLACALDSVVYHKEGASIGGSNRNINKKSYTADYYAIRNRILFTKKYFKICLPTVYLGLLVTVFNRIRRRQFDRIGMILKIVFDSFTMEMGEHHE